MTHKYIGSETEELKNGVKKLQHNLHETGLFSDEALIKLIDQHPAKYLDICAFDDCGEGMKEIIRNGLSAEQLLEAIKKGDIWINLRHLQDGDHEVGRLTSDVHHEIDRFLNQNGKAHVGGLLISSPKSGANYHFDLTMVRLMHIRGKKRIYIYPNENPYLDNKELERVLYERGIEDVAYNPEFDKDCITIDLDPGTWVTWPHLSPHRVRNISGLNVSLTLECITPEARRVNNAAYFDAVTKRKLGFQFLPHKQNLVLQTVKMLIGTTIKRLTKVEERPEEEVCELILDSENLGEVSDFDKLENVA